MGSTGRDSGNIADLALVPGGASSAPDIAEGEHTTTSPRQFVPAAPHIESVHLTHWTFKGMKASEFLDTMLQSETLQRHHMRHRSGANMFITPEQESKVDQALTGKQLRPFHVVITLSLEADLFTTLAARSYRNRPRVMNSHPLTIGDFISKRTFLCEAPLLCEASKRTQSSTEVTTEVSVAHYSSARGINPRRAA